MKIKGYEDYSIYEDGKIISHKNGKTLEMKYYICKNGYKRIDLCKNGKYKKCLLHRLLAIHFIPNPENKYSVDHENRDKLDNSLSNLRWYTHTEQNNNRGGIAEFPITKGGISKHGKGFAYRWCEDKIRKHKYFKTLELAEAFQKDHLETYYLQS